MTKGKFLIYRSSAGSGKTFTLVKNYLELALRSRRSEYFRNILAITFTNKAAREMKDRVLQNLKDLSSGIVESDMRAQLIEDLGISGEELQLRAQKCLTNMLHNYSDISIGTIDQFVHKMIRAFARDLRLMPDFDVEMNTEELIAESVDELISQVGSNKDVEKILLEFTKGRLAEEGNWKVRNDLFEFAKQIGKEDSLDRLKGLDLKTPKAISELHSTMYSDLNAKTKRVINLASESLDLIYKAGLDKGAFNRGVYFTWLQKNQEGEMKEATAMIDQSLDSGMFSGKSAKQEIKDAFLGISDELVKKGEEIISLHAKIVELELLIKGIYPLSTLKRIEDEFQTLCKEEGIVPISSFNKLVSEVVVENPAPFIYERVGERYKHFLIDEFQDTSVLQWQNFLPLIENSLSENNLNLIVGDGKQAIYRWRNGDVEQFMKLPRIHKHGNKPAILNKEPILIRNHEIQILKKNYRSKNVIIQFNNQLFKVLSEKLSPDHQKIYSDSNQKNVGKEGGFVSVNFIDKDSPDSTVFQLESIRIKIADALSSGYKMSDIAILCRRNMDASMIARDLISKDPKYKVVSNVSLLLKHDSSVKLLIGYLRSTLDPLNVEANFELLEGWAGINPEINYQDVLLKNIFVEELPDRKRNETRVQIDHLLDINEIQGKSRDLGLYDFVEFLIQKFNLNKLNNVFVEFFLNHVHQFSLRSVNDIESFIEWWDSNSGNLSIQMSKETDAINVMTIHKSKGLEFPVVIFPFSNMGGAGQGVKVWVDVDNPDMESSLIPLSKKLEKTRFAEAYREERSREILDKLNVFYVACTRARDVLHLYVDQTNRDMLKWSKEIRRAFDLGDSDSVFTMGNMPQKKEGIHKRAARKRSGMISRNLSEPLNMSLDAPKKWKAEMPFGENRRGSIYHEVLGEMILKEDLIHALEKAKAKFHLSNEEVNNVKIDLESLLNTEKVYSWFKAGLKVKNEYAILDHQGHEQRPDRVIIQEDKVIVIDYKTGRKNLAYQDQVQSYMILLHQIFQRPLEGYLLYIDLKQVEAVPSPI